jgi:hypothetical protein
MRKPTLWTFIFPFLFQTLVAQTKITPAEARKHIGEDLTVCGNVASTRYASSTGGQPTFLNLERPYPNQLLTIIIWGRNRGRFGTPEIQYRNRRICVTGRIDDYKGTPEIEAKTPGQIVVEK